MDLDHLLGLVHQLRTSRHLAPYRVREFVPALPVPRRGCNVQGQTNARIDATNTRIDSTRTELAGKIDATNARIDDTNARIDDMNARIDRVLEALAGIGKVADDIEALRADVAKLVDSK